MPITPQTKNFHQASGCDSLPRSQRVARKKPPMASAAAT